MSFNRAVRIHISGVVQGVGFRPFVYGLALDHDLKGWVRNTSAGVDIHVEGPEQQLESFVRVLQVEPPPLASIHEFEPTNCDPEEYSSFEILASEAREGDFIPVSPDVSLCDDCRRELSDPTDRRYHYPFINCTNCGPRFTIINDIPYDRPFTTMAAFEMCDACRTEYENPLDRRFHAQPIACSDCGPHVWLEVDGERVAARENAIEETRFQLKQGKIVAIKGLGGFHLACDATNPEAVEILRQRKLRVDKPFAVMVPTLETAREHAELSQSDEQLLTRRERPIVLVKRKADSSIVPGVAPGQKRLGLMFPYTPLHELVLEPEDGFPSALVMTSGNISEEPIATDNAEALNRLGRLADAFLLHDRDIRTRCDDSVITVFDKDVYPLRRARGYAPYPLELAWKSPPMLAGGPELKNTFCLTQGQNAFISHHIGDLENYETLASYEDGISHYESLFRVKPELLVFDMHPNYLATRYIRDRAEREGLPSIGVQHHHAHIAACMAEHGLSPDTQVIGLSFDGTGYGEDGAIWGGEVLVGNYAEMEREAHLVYVPLPGGDAAIRSPWRIALAWLWHAGLSWEEDLPPVQAGSSEERAIVLSQLEQGLNAPLTSSMGRLFDAAAALIGVRQRVNYEAQAAMELEALADTEESGSYPINLEDEEIDVSPTLTALVHDIRTGLSPEVMAARFHNAIVVLIGEVCDRVQEQRQIKDVVLSGGVWQNMFLLQKSTALLREKDYTVWVHRKVPANDGGISLGQVAIAGARHQKGML